MDELSPKRRPSIKELSKTPSWVMLGFILGAVFVLALPRRQPEPRPIIIARESAPAPRRSEPPQLTTIEAVFQQWSQYAVWSDDVTEVALWNSAVGDFAECYEVRRVADAVYFRSIPHLTNRVIRHGKPVPPECPLEFTETEEQYRDWYEHGRYERPAETPVPGRAVVPTPERQAIEAHLEPVSTPTVRPAPETMLDPKSDVVPQK